MSVRPVWTQAEAAAVGDALSYYALADFGHGGQRPLDDEQRSHRADTASAAQKLERARVAAEAMSS